MLLPMIFILLLLIGCSLVWTVLGYAWVARSPFRIAFVGLFICASGFFIQTQILHTEAIPTWVVQKIPLLSVDHAVLEFFDKLVNVVIYAVGGGIVASALFLRTQLRFEQERREQTKIKEHANRVIAELERALKFLEADACIQGIDNVQQRRDAIQRRLDRHESKLEKANRILSTMGEQL